MALEDWPGRRSLPGAMTYPTKPSPNYDYVSFQASSPADPLPAPELAADLGKHRTSINQVIDFQALIQRSDGKLNAAAVHPDALSAGVVAMIGGWTPKGTWLTATAYVAKDMVTQGNALYVCVTPHTAGVFNTDLAAGKWQLASAPSSGSNVTNTPAGGISATTVQAAINELDAEKQPLDGTLTAVAGLTLAADKLMYATGPDALATTDLSAFARSVLDDADAAAVRATVGAVNKAGDTMTGALLLPGNPSAALHAAPKQYVDAIIAGFGAGGVRQTVVAGPVSSSTGLPTLLPGTATGLNIGTTGVAPSAPFVCTAAQGWSGLNGRSLDRIGYATADLSWTGLTNNTTNYLYVVVNADGTVTPGFTTLAPIDQFGGVPATTNGQFTFNKAEMKGYMGNGTSAAVAYIVFIGEAVTSGGNVTSTVPYAYNGLYDSGYAAQTASSLIVKNHNIGVVPDVVDVTLRNVTTQGGYVPGDVLKLGESIWDNDGSINRSPTVVRDAKTARYRIQAAMNALGYNGGAAFLLTLANWHVRVVAKRGW